MAIQIANNALENCNSIQQVVELINNEPSTDAPAELIAAAYAVDAAREQEQDGGFNEAGIEAQLDCLVEAGANFEYPDALENAVAEIQ